MCIVLYFLSGHALHESSTWFLIKLPACDAENYGFSCARDCSQHCINRECNHISGNCECTSQSRYGGQRCDQQCSYNCGTEGCNQNMSCRGCKPGWWGLECYKTCPQYCRLDDRGTYGCPQNKNGDCSFCENGYHGYQCSQTCPSNCDGRCEKTTGECLCRPGFYGSGCNKNCSVNCVNAQCRKADGHCKCNPGYKNGTCTSGKYILYVHIEPFTTIKNDK